MNDKFNAEASPPDEGASALPPKKRKGIEDALARSLRLEKEASALQASLKDGVMSDVKTKVAWVLNLFPQTRNSDISLTLKYWELFHPDVFHPTTMNPRDLFKLERQTNIVRVRAKIQNEYRLFPADEAVSRHRRALEDDIKEAVIEDTPQRNIAFVYADETGKNADHVCVAAVWVLTGYTIFKLTRAIRLWQNNSPWSKTELHFSEFRKHQVTALGEYLSLIQKHREFLSFKVISIERATVKRPTEEIVRRLHEFMMVRGTHHEVVNSRIKLPHEIRLTVDAEESLDAISCADIQSRVAAAYQLAYGDELLITDVSPISSHKSELVQLADVIAGAFNRRKNHHGERNFKDDMADLIVSALDIQLELGAIPELDATAHLSV